MSDAAAMQPITLGLDLGTSAVKAVAVGFDDEVLGEGSADFRTTSTLAHQAEQEPSDWLGAASSAMHTLGETLQHTLSTEWRKGVAAIGLTGQLPTLVCLSDGAPVAPAITWRDGRADAWAAKRVDAENRARMYALTGMPVDGRYLAPMLEFHFADRLDELQSILSAKDYLLFALTGLEITEPSTAAGYGVFDLQARCFSDDLCEFWNLPRKLLPRLEPANGLAGPLSEAGAALLGLPAGVPVSTGAADSVCAAYSMAGLDERVVAISFGSSAVVIGASSAPRLDPFARYLLTPHARDAWYGREMDLLASGTGYRWLSDLFRWEAGQIEIYAAGSIPGAHGLFFAPYLAGGEQGALWNPRLQGALIGLNLRHSRSDIARAYLEGVFFEVRRCVEVLAETTTVDSVRASGNIVHSAGTRQMLADILARPIAAVPDKSPAAVGAARLARGILEEQGSHDRRPTPSLPMSTPHRSTAAAYAALYPEYVARAALCAS
jgi:xylulokinase